MTVVVTEKPSVARDLAAFLGAKKKGDGFFEGNGYLVTWAFGHLVSLKDPDEYTPEWKRWTTATLPMVPKEFELKCRDDSGTKKQLRTIWNLIKKGQKVICATDAGREGELIFRNILRIMKFEDKPFERLWLSSLTNEAIKEAFENLKPGQDYNNLYAAARCRSEADWIVGLNGTRNLTVRYGNGNLWSMGRVQTPVLALIAERDDEIATFVSEPFWELYTKYKDVVFKHTGKRFSDKGKADALQKKITDTPFEVKKITKKREKVQPPLLFDLTELQREMNRRYGLSAADTLTAAQALYEAKYITYPRTDSQYLKADMKGRLPSTLKNMSERWPEHINKLNLQSLPFNNRIINDKKVTDHHAIIPTGRMPSQLPNAQAHIFEAVALRLIAVFYPNCEKDVTVIEGVAEKTTFRARGVTIANPGWTELYPKSEKDKKDKDDDQILPDFEKGETGPHAPYIKEGKTNPPKYYTENSLLGAMATAGKQVDDNELKEALKDKGIGTPATRAGIIETLLQRKYLKRVKKNLSVTPMGRYLIAIIQDPQLKSAELTGNWEAKLRKMEKGELESQSFMQEIVDFTHSIINDSDCTQVDHNKIGSCPLCQADVIKGKKGYGCSRWKEGCSFVFFPNYKGVTLSIRQVQNLLQRKILLSPIVTSDGDKVVLTLTAKGKILEIPPPVAPERKRSPRKSKSA